MSRIFSKEVLREILFNGMYVSDEQYDTSRWSEHREMIFKWDDKYYGSCYSRGLTEMQDESPYQYDNDYIECDEVREEKVITTRWKVYEEGDEEDTKAPVEMEDLERYFEDQK